MMITSAIHSSTNRIELSQFTYSPIRIESLLVCLESVSESESELLYDWRFTANKFVLASSPLRLTAEFLSSIEHLRS
jgi:hypothetical protein